MVNGLKTYVVALATVVAGIYGVTSGSMSSIEAAPLLSLGLGMAGLRHGMVKKH